MMLPAGLTGMAVAAFAAATPLPMPSEPVFLALQLAAAVPLWALILVASVANTAGSFVTYALGRGVRAAGAGTRLAPSPEAMARGEAWLRRRGAWALLLSWAPGGDLIVLAAGALRMPLLLFGVLVAMAKTGRYAALGAGLSLFA
ncbi:MAG TPA: VTT domain-containing protein [Paracoccaceae bacterium]|nr:VTT domain-containing protein [Paracoccaceae bacterium]